MTYQNKSEQVIKKKNERDALVVHLGMKRTKTSRTLQDLIMYCKENMDDPLIFPVKDNPFRDKRHCTIL